MFPDGWAAIPHGGPPVASPGAEERWRRAAGTRPSGSVARAAAAAIAFHIALALVVSGFDRLDIRRPTAAQEVPVEVVEAPPPDEPPPTPSAPEQLQQPQAAPSAQPAATPQATPSPEPEPQTPATPPQIDEAPKQVPPAQPAQPAQSFNLPSASDPGPQVLVPAEQEQKGEGDGPRAAPPEPSAPAEPEAEPSLPEKEALPSRPTEEAAATAEFRFVPETFRSAAAPAAPQSVADAYKGLIFGLLDRAKRTPPGAEARGAAGIAVLSFMLDTAGNLVSVQLVRPTGDRELDTEALALVRRTAPFPKPPPGVLLSFAPMIRFGLDGR